MLVNRGLAILAIWAVVGFAVERLGDEGDQRLLPTALAASVGFIGTLLIIVTTWLLLAEIKKLTAITAAQRDLFEARPRIASLHKSLAATARSASENGQSEWWGRPRRSDVLLTEEFSRVRAALEILDPEGELDIAWIALRPTRHETTALERLANGDAVTAKTLLADPAYRCDLKRFDREVENFFVATSVVSCRQETGWQKETTLVVGGRKYL